MYSPSSWETSSMTSLGRKGNTKIAGQVGSQPWAWTPDQTKVHNVFSMCLISALTTISSPFLPLSPLFLLFHHPPLSTTLSFSLDISLSFSQTLWSRRQGHTLYSWQAAVCGAFAGAVAAFVTTPLDVAKTRIMLAKAGSTTASGNIPVVLYDVWKSRGLTGLFAGSIPRMTFISLGGFIFLGAYEKVRRSLL
ncbi:hypothetical protein INR49_012603 [Caranx melampygus]|nr:hypothetical protein INR49_012603 [Caranx melampygus]